jgi:lipase
VNRFVFIHVIFQMLGALPVDRFFAPRSAIVHDMLGYGIQIGAPLESINVQHQADHLATQIRACGHVKVHVVGHSVGGIVAMLFARRHPELVASVVNVEGNFTLEDAFWTAKLAKMSVSEISALVASYRNDIGGWLRQIGIVPTTAQIEIARLGLDAQPASTINAMARSVIETTSQPSYLEDVAAVLDSGVPLHLFAGERSRAGWHVPEFVLKRAASITVQGRVGHMMILEAPEEFLTAIAHLEL